MNILFCRPEFKVYNSATKRFEVDLATLYLSTYFEKLVNDARNDGHNVVDLYDDAEGLEARRVPFEQHIPSTDLFIGAGHGNRSTFTAQDFEVLLQDSDNPEVMKLKKCYLASCSTGISLGPALIQNGCPMFAGYQADYWFVYHVLHTSHPLTDPYAQPFFDTALVTGYGFLEGKDPEQIYNETIERYDYWWDYWKTVNDVNGDDVLTKLNWNRQNFIVIAGEEVYAQEGRLALEDLVLPVGALAFLGLLTRSKR